VKEASLGDLEQAGELKFGQVGIANLRVRQFDVARLAAEMAQRVQRAPKLFGRAAVIIDFGSLSRCPDKAEAESLLTALREAGVLPVGLAFGASEMDRLAEALGLPVLAKFRVQYESAAPTPPAAAQTPPEPAPPTAAPPTASASSMLHLQPVRSGQQVYAAGRDLTLCNTVGAGAEVIADGSIHIYGALRGRALAGAQGNDEARIFCREFHAELVAIAGQYRVMEELPAELRGRPVQIRLEAGKLHIEEL